MEQHTQPWVTAAPPLTEAFEQALVYAFHAHANQYRKGCATPYFAHVMAVAALVLENGGSETEAIAALLHDAVEDAGGAERHADIVRRFGREVADIVAECTDTDLTPKPPYRARKEKHLAHMATVTSSGRIVLLADKVHNVRSVLADYQVLGEDLWNRFTGGREGTLWYYAAAVAALDRNDGHPLWLELRRLVEELQLVTAQ